LTGGGRGGSGICICSREDVSKKTIKELKELLNGKGMELIETAFDNQGFNYSEF
jgi:mevalonate kinase